MLRIRINAMTMILTRLTVKFLSTNAHILVSPVTGCQRRFTAEEAEAAGEIK
jgi:hypothetical protein